MHLTIVTSRMNTGSSVLGFQILDFKIRRFVSQEANLDWDEIASESTQEIEETSKSTDVYFIGATSAGKSCILSRIDKSS